MSWSAQTHLYVLEGAGLSKNVSVFDRQGFGWGFEQSVDGGNKSVRRIIVSKVEALDVQKEWGEKLGLLEENYQEWTFQDGAV